MVPFSKRLEHFGLTFDLSMDSRSLTEDSTLFSQADKKKTIHQLLGEHSQISLEYNVLRCQLAKHLKKPMNEETKELLLVTFLLAQLLELMYFYYLDVPHEVNQYYQDKECLRDWLIANGYDFERKQKLTKTEPPVSKIIGEVTTKSNWPRLFIVRTKKVLDALSSALPSYKAYHGFVEHMDGVADPVFSILASVFFLPRFANNVFHIYKHVVQGSWTGEKEKSLGRTMCLRIQMERRGFELLNDSIWLSVGVLGVINTFILVGVLTTAVLYLSVFFYAVDVFLAGLRAYIEWGRLKKLQDHYSQALVLENEDSQNAEDYYDLLNKRIEYETLRMIVSIATTLSVFVGMSLTLPIFVLNPIVPLVGLSFVLLVCLINFAAGKYIERYKPTEKLEKPEPYPSERLRKDDHDLSPLHAQNPQRLFARRLSQQGMKRTFSLSEINRYPEKDHQIAWRTEGSINESDLIVRAGR